jgi:type I restriction enzyme, S subunit
MTFPCYPKYKASGFIWLGDVPESWALKRLGHYFDERRERASDTEFEPLSVTKHGIVPRLESAAKTQDGDNRKKVLAGDFVINSRSDRKGSSGLSPLDGSVSLICTVLTPSGLHGPFIHHLFRSELFQEEYYRWGKGIVADLWSTNFSDMKNIVLGVPSEAEQTQIARFLDHETARIDALIEEQQRLIELLKEKRQAVISHVVTKGLDPTVPMKDSGVEWLGEVPAHWEVVRLKNISRIVDCKNRTPDYVDDGDYLVVRTTNIKKQQLSLEGALYTDRKNFEIWTERGVPPPGSIFFTREAPSGEVCIVPENTPLCMGQRMMNIIPSDSGLTPFIFDFLTSDCLTKYIESEASGSTVVHLRVEQVYNIPLIVPPESERHSIDRLVSELKLKYESLINHSEASAALLYERRSALISAAVTGKIDVRGWQPPVSTTPPELALEAV